MEKVMVAMSGGVDSSVVAALLVDQGYDVCGVTLKLREDEEDTVCNTRTCCSLDDIEDARRVCAKLGIRHVVFSFVAEFKKDVIDNFSGGYEDGETPNPCIDCNRFIKFPLLLDKARKLEYDKIATGHYVKKVFDESTGRYTLETASDDSKDQSYVLYAMTQDELKHTLFPLSDLPKSKVREIAIEKKLVNARKPDSQDICFIPDGDYASFIKKQGTEIKAGDYLDLEGNVIGQHKGHMHYTVGQRKGLGISFAAPRYVYSKDAQNNTVTLVSKEDLTADTMNVKELNWMGIEAPVEPFKANTKTRYHQKEIPSTIYPKKDGTVEVVFDTPAGVPAPGQAAVFYKDKRILGGGTIIKQK